MNYTVSSNSEIISKFCCLPKRIEQSFNDAVKSSANGIFVGCSAIYSIPFFIDFEQLINPHVFVLGMSGGGKTFLMRNLILKIHAVLGSTIMILDFTGEYKQFTEFLSIKESDLGEMRRCVNWDGFKVFYFNLRSYSEVEKIRIAEEALHYIVDMMHRSNFDAQNRVFIFLDEAWKLLRENKDLEIVIREGRRYRFGLVLASQLVEDVELPFLANSATFFIFRVQNKKSLGRLSKNYSLDEKTVLAIQNLQVGSCMIIQTYKSKPREALIIKRVIGIEMKKYVRVMFGDIMIEIQEEELGAIIRRLCKKDPSVLISEISSYRSVELGILIKKLILFGAERREILSSLRDLGIEDYEISDAFAFAMEEIDGGDGQ